MTRALQFLTAARAAFNEAYSENLPAWPEALAFAAFGCVMAFGMVVS
jgi:hypothetical protein